MLNEVIRIRLVSNFLDSFRLVVANKYLGPGDNTKILFLRNELNTLKEAQRSYYPGEAAGSALTIRLFKGVRFMKDDLEKIINLRKFCRQHGAMSDQGMYPSSTLLYHDFSTLSLQICLDLAVQIVASQNSGPSVDSCIAYNNLWKKINDDSEYLRKSLLGQQVQREIDEMNRYVDEQTQPNGVGLSSYDLVARIQHRNTRLSASLRVSRYVRRFRDLEHL